MGYPHRFCTGWLCAALRPWKGGRVQAFRQEVTARLVELAPLLLGRLDDMNDRMVEMLLSTEPAYREFASHSATELRTSTRAGIERGVRGLIGGLPRGASMAGAREVGRRRAAQGIPLEAVLRAYRYAGQVMWEGLLDAAQAAGRGDDPLLLEGAGSIWRTHHIEGGGGAGSYPEEQRRLAGVDEAARQHVLDGLLDGRGGDPTFLRTASELLAVPLDGRLLAVVALPDPDGAAGPADPARPPPRRGGRPGWGPPPGGRGGGGG